MADFHFSLIETAKVSGVDSEDLIKGLEKLTTIMLNLRYSGGIIEYGGITKAHRTNGRKKK